MWLGQGDYTDPATGLVYMNARWYNPATGGFVSSDTANGTPIPFTVGGNPYAYAGGNPLTNADPTGYCVSGFSWLCSAWYEASQPAADVSCIFDAECGGGLALRTYWDDFFYGSDGMTGQDECTGCECGSDCGSHSSGPVHHEPAHHDSPGCGVLCGAVGVVTTGVTAACAEEPEICATVTDPAPLPIPPPNCYASGHCKPTPTPTPKSLLQHYRDTNPVTNNLSVGKLCTEDLCVNENYKLK